ncbi:hypothetical protein FHX81_5590 [Saccharothrix saharensis]|uniref:Uncharacterized protein n=1 Tax=Saccharothrix saharensis TaxID=571190 RepID=A0A543JJZ3_9PSEU|nr:hypothetical protein [Saccharothrix saharensis]TQM83172.1 hypothetical protein FHX81_5590 [Saccharothrix saharensis]
MSGVAFVFGMCALSFAAGCVLTAVMLRREPPPDPRPEPAPAPPPRFEPRFPPEDYATKPIHRNPVMGLPPALPTQRPARPNLVVVPDPKPSAVLPVRQDAVRRMHVVRPAPTLVEPAGEADAAGAIAEGPVPPKPLAVVAGGANTGAPAAEAAGTENPAAGEEPAEPVNPTGSALPQEEPAGHEPEAVQPEPTPGQPEAEPVTGGGTRVRGGPPGIHPVAGR